MTVAINMVVLHAPWDAYRRMLLVKLRMRLGRIDPPHTFSVCPDIYRKGFWPAARRAWIAAGLRSDATHVWVMADDIHPCPDIIPALERILTAHPDDPIALMSARKEVLKADPPYFLAHDALCGGGVVVPICDARAFIPWCDRYIPSSYAHDDGRLSLYFQSKRKLIRNVVPSLVQHEAPKNSLLGHFGNWTAPRFVGFDGSALSVDWGKPDRDLLVSPRASSCHRDLRMLTPEVRRQIGLDHILQEDLHATSVACSNRTPRYDGEDDAEPPVPSA